MRISWGEDARQGFFHCNVCTERSRCAGGLFQWHSICRSALLIHVQAIKRFSDPLLQWRADRWPWCRFFFAPQDVRRDLTLILLLEFRDFGPPENLHTALAFAAPARAVGAIGPAAGVLGFPHMVRGYRQGV